MNAEQANQLREGDFIANRDGTRFKFLRLDEDGDLIVEYQGSLTGEITMLRDQCEFSYPETTRFEFFLKDNNTGTLSSWGHRADFEAAKRRFKYLTDTFIQKGYVVKCHAVNLIRSERDITSEIQRETRDDLEK